MDTTQTNPGLSLLFVDDCKAVLMAIQRMLQNTTDAWHVEVADSGMRALEIMQTRTFDVVITDIGMPDLRGTELIKHIRKIDPATCCMLFTGGYIDPVDLIDCGSSGLLQKPCSVQTIRESIADALLRHNRVAA